MSEGGFIKLYRKMMNWGWYKDSKVKSLFIHCLLKANHQDSQWHHILVKRGSFLTSISHLADETGLTIKEVRGALERLEESKCLVKTSTAKNTMITVCHYEEYQSGGKTEGKVKGKVTKAEKPHKHKCSKASGQTDGQSKGQDKGQGEGKVRARSGQSEGKVRATNKNEKKYLSPIRETDTAYPPARLEGGGRVPPEQPSAAMPDTQQSAAVPPNDTPPKGIAPVPPKGIALVPAKEMLDFASKVPGGQREVMWAFRSAFESSGTRMPVEWQDFYVRFAAADVFQQDAFLQKLKAGDYREKWGVLDADT